MHVSDFDFALPPESIAQRPAPRGTSRLLALDRATGAVTHEHVADLPRHLHAGDVLVVNDTKVIPARLFGVDGEGRRTEVLLVRRTEDAGETWECLAKPGRRAKPGRTFRFGAGVTGTVLRKSDAGPYVLSFSGPLQGVLPVIGTAPLPPYIHRPEGLADAQDALDYQTVYAKEPGAIAAPTAGLHLTEELLATLRGKGVEIVTVTLHVGLGTFKPVKVAETEDHVMEEERGVIPEETAAALSRAQAEGRPVVAVGTTTVRTLESSARENGGRVAAGPFRTRLFLTPGSTFQIVDAILTNFHLPRSTLLMLVSAFAGRERVLAAYTEAVSAGYRFFSYGDAMLIGADTASSS